MDTKNLYSESDMQLMRAAEDSLLMGQNRVAELKLFTENNGIKRIGIAHWCGHDQRGIET